MFDQTSPFGPKGKINPNHNRVQTSPEHPFLVKYQMVISEVIHKSNFIPNEIKFRNTYVQPHTYINVVEINKIRHEFEREQGGVYGKVWKEEMEGQMM